MYEFSRANFMDANIIIAEVIKTSGGFLGYSESGLYFELIDSDLKLCEGMFVACHQRWNASGNPKEIDSYLTPFDYATEEEYVKQETYHAWLLEHARGVSK